MGLVDPLEKMDEKLKSENMQKKQFSERGLGWSDMSDDWLVKLMIIIVVIIIDILLPFRNFQNFQQAARGYWHPLTKILWTPLDISEPSST